MGDLPIIGISFVSVSTDHDIAEYDLGWSTWVKLDRGIPSASLWAQYPFGRVFRKWTSEKYEYSIRNILIIWILETDIGTPDIFEWKIRCIKRETHKCKITRSITKMLPRIGKDLSISWTENDDFFTLISIICSRGTDFSTFLQSKREGCRIFLRIEKLSIYGKSERDAIFSFELFECFFRIERLSWSLIPFDRASKWEDSESIF